MVAWMDAVQFDPHFPVTGSSFDPPTSPTPFLNHSEESRKELTTVHPGPAAVVVVHSSSRFGRRFLCGEVHLINTKSRFTALKTNYVT